MRLGDDATPHKAVVAVRVENSKIIKMSRSLPLNHEICGLFSPKEAINHYR